MTTAPKPTFVDLTAVLMERLGLLFVYDTPDHHGLDKPLMTFPQNCLDRGMDKLHCCINGTSCGQIEVTVCITTLPRVTGSNCHTQYCQLYELDAIMCLQRGGLTLTVVLALEL